MADPERGLWERSNFKELPQFLKSDRISLAYGLTSNKDQTFINKSCFVFFLYRGICWFCAIFGSVGGMTGVDLFGSAFEGHGSAPPVNRYICMPSIFKRRCLHRLFPKSACKFQCIGELYHRFKQNVSESESRQFDRLRLRLRLLARSHDSGRLRLRLRLRLRTPAWKSLWSVRLSRHFTVRKGEVEWALESQEVSKSFSALLSCMIKVFMDYFNEMLVIDSALPVSSMTNFNRLTRLWNTYINELVSEIFLIRVAFGHANKKIQALVH